MDIEQHPLKPFLPAEAVMLMLGSFPPQKKRWSMEFFYPNWNNDMWRIWGYITAGDKNHFVVPGEKRFDKERIERFCRERGIAMFDTAEAVIRLKDNASDNFLQIVRPTDLASLLQQLPSCRSIVATGQKSAETLQEMIGFPSLSIGDSYEVEYLGRRLKVWRMPSSSRAYPRSVEWKAEYYRRLLDDMANHR